MSHRFNTLARVALLGIVLSTYCRHAASVGRTLDHLISTAEVDGMVLTQLIGRIERLEQVRLKIDVEAEDGPPVPGQVWVPVLVREGVQ